MGPQCSNAVSSDLQALYGVWEQFNILGYWRTNLIDPKIYHQNCFMVICLLLKTLRKSLTFWGGILHDFGCVSLGVHQRLGCLRPGSGKSISGRTQSSLNVLFISFFVCYQSVCNSSYGEWCHVWDLGAQFFN